MTILPKKKTPGPKSDTETGSEHGHGQAAESLDSRLFPGQSSPPRWPPPASGSDKRLSPLHQLDYEDSLDGAPSSKRSRHHLCQYQFRPPTTLASCSSRVPSPVPERGQEEEEEEEGYNSEDEYSHVGQNLTEEQWRDKDLRFERVMRRKGYIIKKMGEDGACLFRAVADQLYGDEEMHQAVRTQCLDYIERNTDYFSQYVTEPFAEYVRRKRRSHVHGNHLEIQALAEMFCRPIHIYSYSSEPINIFQHIPQSESDISIPMRLCYHRGVHYNSLVDPNNASLGVGLGLPGLKPGINDKNTVREALKRSDNNQTEQMMIEDKLKATDWEATDVAVAEQVARESYLQWLADQEKARKAGAGRHPPAATVTSGAVSPVVPSTAPSQVSGHGSGQASPRGHGSGQASPRGGSSPRPTTSPKAGCSYTSDSPKPCSSRSDHGLGPGFHLRETASFLNGLPPNAFAGLEDWGEDAVLHQVLAASHQEYLDSLKTRESGESQGDSEPAEDKDQNSN